MARNRAQWRALLHVPDLDFAAARGQAAGRRQQFAVRRKCHSAHVFGLAGKRGDNFAGFGFHQPDFLKCAQRQQFAIGPERQRTDQRLQRDTRLDIRNRRRARCHDLARSRRLCACIDPLADDLDLAVRQLLSAQRHGRRHRAGDPQIQEALVALAGHDDRSAVAAFLQALESIQIESCPW